METKKRLIYANEVIEEIDEIIGNINFSSPYQNDIHLIVDGLERARDCVLDIPTVDAVEVVHGRWIPIIDEPTPLRNFAMISGYECLICGRYEDEEEPYCNCGAKMMEDEDDG